MSVRSTATLNVPLTTYAQGIAADQLSAYRLANLICPIVQVGAAAGTFKKFDDRNSFLAEASERALGGNRKRLQFEASDDTYLCKPHGLEIGLDDFESDLVGAAGGAQRMNLLAQGKIKSLVNRKAVTYAKRVTDFAFANLTPVAGKGQWTNDAIDPIDQLDEQLETLSLDVNSVENIAVILSVSTWRKIRSNALVKKRLGLKPELQLTPSMLVAGLLFPVKLEVSAVVSTTKKFGQAVVATGEKTALMGDYCLLTHSMPNPSEFDPSPFKCFSTSSVLVDSVRTYREEGSNSDIHAVDWSEDIKQTSTLAARVIAIT